MNAFWSVSRKLGIAFAMLFLFIGLCGVAGYRGTSALRGRLDYVLGPILGTVHGAAELSRAIGAQMNDVQTILSGGVSESRRENVLAEQRRLDEKIDRLLLTIDASVYEEAEILQQLTRDYRGARDGLEEVHGRFADRNAELLSGFDRFQRFMEELERFEAQQKEKQEQSDEEAEELGFDFSGLAGALAASSGSDVHIQLLAWFYRYQRLTSDESGGNGAVTRLDETLEALKHKASNLMTLSAFDTVPEGNPYQGRTYSAVLRDFLTGHEKSYRAALEQFTAFRKSHVEYRSRADRLLGHLGKFRQAADRAVEGERQRVAAAVQTADRLMTLTLVLGLIVAIGFGIYSVFFISRPLREVADAMVDFTAGRMDVEVPAITTADEVGSLGRSLEELIGEVRKREVRIREASLVLGEEAKNVAEASNEQNALVSEQASAIRETATAATELRSMTARAKGVAEEVHKVAEQTNRWGHEGMSANQEAKEGVLRMAARINEIADTVASLSRKMEQIGEILAAVNELAEQSKLLALNAAIEAARAGEHGKGFGVVSLEVRNLAQQSQDATKQIRTIIREISETMRPALSAAEDGQQDARRGREAIERTETVIGELAAALSKSADAAEKIMRSVNQQDVGIEQISGAIDNIDQALERSVSTAERTLAVSERLLVAEQDLKHLVTEVFTGDDGRAPDAR